MFLINRKGAKINKTIDILLRNDVSEYEKKGAIEQLNTYEVARVYSTLSRMSHDANKKGKQYYDKYDGKDAGSKILKWAIGLSSVACSAVLPVVLGSHAGSSLNNGAVLVGGLAFGIILPQVVGIYIKKALDARNYNKSQKYYGMRNQIDKARGIIDKFANPFMERGSYKESCERY